MSITRQCRTDPEARPRPFAPPHCPNRACDFFQPREEWSYRREGWLRSPAHPRRLQRFRCLHCKRKFSERTFETTYWLHRRRLFPQIAALSVAGAGLRQIARTFGISHSTVARHLARAGRHCLLFHRQLLHASPNWEPIAFDGFETFEHSQFFPFHLNLAAGRSSWFLYHFTESPLRRKGRMTVEQRRQRAELEAALGRPDPKAVERGVFELLRGLRRGTGWREDASNPSLRSSGDEGFSTSRPLPPQLHLHSDEHPAYRRAIRRLQDTDPGLRVRHDVTPSTAPRTTANPLCAVNLADLLLRHCGANHRRETIAFSKRRQAAIERLAVFLVWRNAIKWRREKKPGETAAMRAGLARRRLSWSDVFARRLFPRRNALPGVWWSYYWRKVRTAVLGSRQARHTLKFAF